VNPRVGNLIPAPSGIFFSRRVSSEDLRSDSRARCSEIDSQQQYLSSTSAVQSGGTNSIVDLLEQPVTFVVQGGSRPPNVPKPSAPPTSMALLDLADGFIIKQKPTRSLRSRWRTQTHQSISGLCWQTTLTPAGPQRRRRRRVVMIGAGTPAPPPAQRARHCCSSSLCAGLQERGWESCVGLITFWPDHHMYCAAKRLFLPSYLVHTCVHQCPEVSSGTSSHRSVAEIDPETVAVRDSR